jgi:PIN domain nuclease of toxin-antitoxin system
VIWATLSPTGLSVQAQEMVADPANVILVSAASAWGIASKVSIGKLPGAEKLERDYLRVMDGAGYTLLPIDSESALRAGRLIADRRDLFDRNDRRSGAGSRHPHSEPRSGARPVQHPPHLVGWALAIDY